MEALDARYPFLQSARAAVESAGVDLAALVEDDAAVIDRAMERVRGAIEDGTVGAPARSDRVELLSYPVARVLVSLIDEPGLIHRYARAEADAARERFVADLEGSDELKSVGRARISIETLLSEFDLQDAVELSDVDRAEDTAADTAGAVPPVVGVEVGVYLNLAEELSDPRWDLKRRSLAAGTVVISREELYDLLREAIRDRVAAALPLAVPDSIEAALAARLDTLHTLLADHDHEWDVGRVEPESFPPCMAALVDRAGGEDPLPAHSQFSLASFLITTGMDTDEIASLLSGPDATGDDRLADRIDRLREDEATASYPPPSCETMVAYGDCVNKDSLCERIIHPLDYYERRLAGDTPE